MLCMVNVRHVIAKCLGLLGIEPIENVKCEIMQKKLNQANRQNQELLIS